MTDVAPEMEMSAAEAFEMLGIAMTWVPRSHVAAPFAAIDALHSLLLRAEEERDHWKSEATGLASEQRVAEAAEGERDVARKAHDEMLAHYMELERELLRAEEERDALRNVLGYIGAGSVPAFRFQELARAALIPEETKEAEET